MTPSTSQSRANGPSLAGLSKLNDRAAERGRLACGRGSASVVRTPSILAAMMTLLLLALTVGAAEPAPVELTVHVRHEHGPLPGVTISLVCEGMKNEVISDAEGRATFLVRPGEYRIVAELAGFKTITKKLDVTSPTVLKIDMPLAPIDSILIACPWGPRVPDPFTFSVTRWTIQGQSIR